MVSFNYPQMPSLMTNDNVEPSLIVTMQNSINPVTIQQDKASIELKEETDQDVQLPDCNVIPQANILYARDQYQSNQSKLHQYTISEMSVGDDQTSI